MKSAARNNLASRYFVENLTGVAQTGAKLNGILAKIDVGEPLSRLSLDFLSTSGFKALHALANDLIDSTAFQNMAEMERKKQHIGRDITQGADKSGCTCQTSCTAMQRSKHILRR